MSSDFEVSTFIARSPQVVYNAWLDSDEHSNMTGSPAEVSDEVGGHFKAWDGYINGTNLELEPDKRILQSWRTSKFEAAEGDSQIEITFEAVEEGTKVSLRHTNLPAHGAQYEQGWEESYFQPMRRYFLF